MLAQRRAAALALGRRLKTARRIGLLSDTHGLLRPEALEFLRGSDFIVHAGDIGDAAVLDTLRTLAPVTAVRGNNDRDGWARAIAETEVLRVDEVSIHILHDLAELDLDPAAAGFRVVLSGHSHQPRIEERDGVLYVNPGSCGPRRFKLPIAVGELRISGNSVKAKLVELKLAVA
jgi:putative phosphoesterase